MVIHLLLCNKHFLILIKKCNFQIEPEKVNKSVSSPKDFFAKLYGPSDNQTCTQPIKPVSHPPTSPDGSLNGDGPPSPHSFHIPTTMSTGGGLPPVTAASLLGHAAYPGGYLPYHAAAAAAAASADPAGLFRFDGFHLPGGLAAFCKYLILIVIILLKSISFRAYFFY